MSTLCPVYFRFVLFNLASLQLLLLLYAKVLTKDAGVFLTVVPDPAWLDSCCNSEAPLALNGPSQASRWWVELLCHPKRKREGNTPVSFFLCQHNGLSSWWALNSSLPRRRGLPGSWSIHLLSGSADDVMTVRSSSEFLLRVILVRCLTSHLTRQPLPFALATFSHTSWPVFKGPVWEIFKEAWNLGKPAWWKVFYLGHRRHRLPWISGFLKIIIEQDAWKQGALLYVHSFKYMNCSKGRKTTFSLIVLQA